MRASLRQVLFRSTAGLDLNFAGGAFSLNNTRTDTPAAIPGWSFSRTDTNGTATALDLAGNVIQFPSRTNSLFPSNNFGDARWSDFSTGTTTRTSGFSDPEGGTTAWRLQGNNANTWWGNSGGTAAPPSGGTWASKTATFSMWVRADAAYTAVLILNFNGGTSYSLNISVTDTWQRFTFTQTFVAGDTNTLRGVINHKSGNNTYVFGAQIEETSTATAYIPTTTAAVTVVLPRITNRGILVEEARTNVITTSAFQTLSGTAPTQFPSGTGWSNFFATGGTRSFVASTVFAGGQAASLAGVTAARNVLGFSFSPTASTTYTVSFFVEAASGVTGTVAYASGTLGVGGTTNLVSAPSATGRYSYTFTTGTGPGVVDLRFGIGTTTNESGSLTISNIQCEAGAFATSPIITTGAAGTRGADGGRITQSPTASGTIIATVRIPTDKNNRRVVGTNGASAVTPLAYSTAGIETYNGSSTLGKTVSMTAGALVTVGVTWESGRRSVTGAGLAVATDANAIGSFTEMWFGQDDSLAAGNALNESIVRVQVLPYAVTDAQLQALTAP